MQGKYLSDRAKALTPYVAGEQPKAENLIKLNTNENPYPPSPRVTEAVLSRIPALRLYPPTEGGELRSAVAKRENLPEDWVFVGNGSDEVLALCFPTFFGPERVPSFPEITYSFYPSYASLYEIPYRQSRILDDLSVDVEDLLKGGPVIIANPNAPTSLALPLDVLGGIAKALAARGDAFIVDEAYVEFGAKSARALIEGYDNVLVVRTLSKSHSLAGMRCAYALGNPALIEGLERTKSAFNSYPLDHLAIAAGAAALLDEAYFTSTRDRIMATRAWFSEGLRALGCEVPLSMTNFVFAKIPKPGARAVFGALREQGIIVRFFDKPRLNEYLRISIGTDDEMHRVLAALGDILK